MRRLRPDSLLVLVFGAGELGWLLFRLGVPPRVLVLGLALWVLLWLAWAFRLPEEHPVLARAVLYTLPIGVCLWVLAWLAEAIAPLDLSPWVLGWLAGVMGLALAILVGAQGDYN